MRPITVAALIVFALTLPGRVPAQPVDGPVPAQEVASELHAGSLSGVLRRGDHVIVIERSGHRVEGRFVAVHEASISVTRRSGPRIDIPASSIAQIDRVTSRVRKGALTGLLVGAAAGAMAVAATASCHNCLGPSKGAAILPIAGIFGGIGAGIGAAVGAMHQERRVVYRAPEAETRGITPETRDRR